MTNISERCRYRPGMAFISWAAAVFFLVCSIPCGASEHIDQLAALLQKRYENTLDLSASFTQETRSPAGGQETRARGKVFLKRPGLMRWEYVSPEPQLIVTVRNLIYIYEKDANQVMVMPRDRLLSSGITKAFFFGKGSLKHFFILKKPGKNWPHRQWTLCLVPRSENPQVDRMWITIDEKTHLVREIWIQDKLGTRTHLTFFDMKVNKGLKDSLFSFEPPAGVEVYRAQDGF